MSRIVLEVRRGVGDLDSRHGFCAESTLRAASAIPRRCMIVEDKYVGVFFITDWLIPTPRPDLQNEKAVHRSDRKLRPGLH